MKELVSFQIYEERQALSMMDIVAVLLILALALCFVQHHVSEYKNDQTKKEIFQKIEQEKVEQFFSYRVYGTYGFRMLFLPASISILFSNSTFLSEMMAFIDSSERLNIYKPLKSKNVFDSNKYMFADCSGIFLFFGGLLGLFYGYMAFLHTEYLKFLASITGKKKLFSSIYLSRASILVQFSLVYLASAVLLITINGVAIGIDQYLVVLFIKMCGVSLAFFAVGAVFGLCESIFVGLAGAIASWFLLLFIIPFIVSVIVSAYSGTIKPENQLEIEKFKLMMDHEKRFNDETGILPLNKKPTQRQSELVLGYYKNEFQKILTLENMLKAQMQECTKLHYMLSAFFPTTGYLALTQELSSKGYENLYAFYQDVIQIKEAFFKEYMKQVYFSNQPTQPAKVEPFLKGDENIFIGKPALPGYLLLDFFFNLLWIVGFGVLAYYRFNKSLFALPKKEENAPEPDDIKLKSGKMISWCVIGNFLNRQLYNLLSNEIREFTKKGYSFLVSLDDRVLNTAKQRQNFFYLCHPSAFPGYLKVKNLLTLVMDLLKIDDAVRKDIAARFSLDAMANKKIRRLNIDERGRLILAILHLKPFPIYLIDDIGRGMLLEHCFTLDEKLLSLWDNGAAVLFLTGEISIILKSKGKNVPFFESDHWVNQVYAFREGQYTDTKGDA